MPDCLSPVSLQDNNQREQENGSEIDSAERSPQAHNATVRAITTPPHWFINESINKEKISRLE
jgi:hypothetical protein